MTKKQKTIFKYLTSTLGLNNAAACGVIANFEAESACTPSNLQNSFEKKRCHTNTSYTKAVDKGSIAILCTTKRVTAWLNGSTTLAKRRCLNLHEKIGKSIGDLQMQRA